MSTKIKLGIIGIVGEEMARDRRSTLRALRVLGYSGLELGLDGLKREGNGWREALAEVGMEIITCHLLREALVAEARDETVRVLREASVRHATVSWAPVESEGQIQEDARLYAEAGAVLRASGITLCYHNHEHELACRFGGRTALDILLGAVGADALALHLDVAWATYGGADPAALLERYAGRVPLLHVKDLYHLGPRGCFTAPGTGCVDLGSALKAAVTAGSEWFTVEQDQPRRLRGMDLATAAVLNLRELGFHPG